MLTAFAILTDGLVYAAYLFLVAVGLTPDLRGDEDPQCHPRLVLRLRRLWRGDARSASISSAAGRPRAASCSWCWSRWRSGSCSASCSSAAAAARLRQGRGDRRARHLCRLPDPRRRDRADLGHRVPIRSISRWSPPATSRSAIWCCPATTSVWSRSRRVVAIGAYWALKHTRYGRLLTVVIFDRETAAAFGINVTVVLHRDLRASARCWARSAARSWRRRFR